MKNIVTNTCSFERLIARDHVYVDKTEILRRLVDESMGNMFFISRPRRFGKSLMLSTLRALFEGRRELFRGLEIEKAEWDWSKTYPVILLDMQTLKADSLEDLEANLYGEAQEIADRFGVAVDWSRCRNSGAAFSRTLEAIGAKAGPFVVLIDEYDVPLQGFLGTEEANAVRTVLHDFYVALKASDEHIRFLMMTGVSRFAKLSVFSGLNNLTDLSSQADFATLLGYTEEELRTNFAGQLEAFSRAESTTVDAIVARLRAWYDGYRFSPQSACRVFNPVSVGLALNERAIQGYWNSTGSSSLIVERLRQAGRLPCDLERVPATREILDSCDPVTLPVEPLLYQGGYLTICGVEDQGLMLGVPNHEVRLALTSGHLTSVLGDDLGRQYQSASVWAGIALRKGDVLRAVDLFRSAFAALPYEWLVRDEGAAKVAFLDFFSALPSAVIHAERETANGRIDAVIELADAVYIFEFKCGATSREAFDQIVTSDYAAPYRDGARRIFGIGLNYRPKAGMRGIDDPIVRELQGGIREEA